MAQSPFRKGSSARPRPALTCVKEAARDFLALDQGTVLRKGRKDDVRTFVFRCPTTGYNVQGRYEESNSPLPTFVGQHCLACSGLHVVDPRTGKGMSELRAVAARRKSSDPTSSSD